ncbi:MAG: sigma-70 family RNA polymerase sigma factor [Gemmatimonadetes bacterium]|jgi:RNA polymerase sigma factor (sigma-70 family)|nr:sigma-70 family RNA polymerase sigma factor [Gemmatimonadota bacterium]
MAIRRSREHALARPNPLYPTFTASQCAIESLLKIWDEDIVRAARSVVARERSLSDDAADECAQAARVALARIAHRADKVGPSYLRRVIQNAVRDEARRERRTYGGIPMDKTTAEVAAEAAAEDPDDAISRVIQWTAALPDRLQEVYDLLYVRGYSQRAAAAVMNVSQPRVAQLHRDLLARGKAELSLWAA